DWRPAGPLTHALLTARRYRHADAPERALAARVPGGTAAGLAAPPAARRQRLPPRRPAPRGSAPRRRALPVPLGRGQPRPRLVDLEPQRDVRLDVRARVDRGPPD